MEFKEEWLLPNAVVPVDATTTRLLVEQIKTMLVTIGQIVIEQQPAETQYKPLAWLYPEGLEALKQGKSWTAYGTQQEEPCSIPVYLHPPESNQVPYAWVTFTAYGDEDDVWYENPEGKLLEGWTYRPLYDTSPQPAAWVRLEQVDIDKSWDWAQKSSQYGVTRIDTFARAIEAKLREKNT